MNGMNDPYQVSQEQVKDLSDAIDRRIVEQAIRKLREMQVFFEDSVRP